MKDNKKEIVTGNEHIFDNIYNKLDNIVERQERIDEYYSVIEELIHLLEWKFKERG